jgi:hypothetical protein
MPRKPALVPTEHLHIKLEAATRAKMDLFLYSPLEGRVPKGGHKAFIEMLIAEFFARSADKATQGEIV